MVKKFFMKKYYDKKRYQIMKCNKESIISAILIVLGVFTLTYEFVMCLVSNINLGIILVFLLGIFMLLTGIFYNKIKKYSHTKFFKICGVVLAILFCAEIFLVSFIAVYGVIDKVDFKEDAVIVLGAGIRGELVTMPLKLRLDKAVEYHHKNPDALIVVTGGQGPQESVTEAYAMEKYLIKKGISKEKIIKEEKATSTNENMEFSKEILDSRFENDYSVVIITNNFHILRSVNIARKTGFSNVSGFHAGLEWYNLVPCYLRESLAVLKMVVFG